MQETLMNLDQVSLSRVLEIGRKRRNFIVLWLTLEL